MCSGKAKVVPLVSVELYLDSTHRIELRPSAQVIVQEVPAPCTPKMMLRSQVGVSTDFAPGASRGSELRLGQVPRFARALSVFIATQPRLSAFVMLRPRAAGTAQFWVITLTCGYRRTSLQR